MDRKKERFYPHVYVLIQHWASGVEQGNSAEIYTDFDDAKSEMDKILEEEIRNSIEALRGRDGFVEESTEDAYECYIEGEYCENHYSIAIELREMCVSGRFIEELIRMKDTDR